MVLERPNVYTFGVDILMNNKLSECVFYFTNFNYKFIDINVEIVLRKSLVAFVDAFDILCNTIPWFHKQGLGLITD